MAITVKCGKCGAGYKVADDNAGKRFKCKKCAAPIAIPAADEPEDEWDFGGDEWDQPAAAPAPPTAGARPTARQSSSGGKKKKKKGSKKSGVNPLVYVGAGAGVLLIALGVGLFLLLGGDDDVDVPLQNNDVAQADPAETPVGTPDAPQQDNTVASNGTTPANVEESVGNSGHLQPPAGGTANVKVGGEPVTLIDALTTRNRLQRIGLALQNLHRSQQAFAPAYNQQSPWFDDDGSLKVSWRVHVLMMLGEFELYQQFKLDEPWDSPHNKPLLDKMPDVYRSSPGDEGTTTRFVVFTGEGAPFGPKKAPRMRDFSDGSGNTVLVVEAGPEKAVPWTKPDDLAFDPQSALASLGTVNKAGIHVLMADGSVNTLQPSVPADVFTALVTNSGGEIVDFRAHTVEIDEAALLADAKPAPEGPLPLAFLTEDCFAVAVLNPQRLLQSPLLKDMPIEQGIEATQRQFHEDPRGVEQVVLWATPPVEGDPGGLKSGAALAIRFTNKPDRPPDPSYEPVRYDGWIYHRGTEMERLPPAEGTTRPRWVNVTVAKFQIDERTAVFGREPVIQKMLSSGNAKTPLASRLEQVGLDADLIAMFDAAAAGTGGQSALIDLTQSMRGVPPDFASFMSLPEQANSAELRIDLSGESLLKLAFEGKDAAGADALFKMAEQARGTLDQEYQALRQIAGQRWQPSSLRFMDKFIAALTVEKTSNGVNVDWKNPGGLAEFAQNTIKPTILQAQAAADAVRRQNYMRQIGLALHNFHDSYGRFPLADNPKLFDESGKPKLSWRVHILPFLDEFALYQQFKVDEPWDSPNNKALLDKIPDVYKTTDDPTKTTYVTFTGEGTPFSGEMGPTMRDFTDGTSNTLLVVKVGADKAVPWTKPEDLVFDPQNPKAALGEFPDEGIQALLANGAVVMLPKNIPAATLKALITHHGGEPVNPAALQP